MPDIASSLRPDEYLAYYRKSKGRSGISRQRATTERHIARLGGKIIAEYVDADRTAYSGPGAPLPERPGFTAMLTCLRRLPGTGVAAWHADRIARTSREAAIIGRLSADVGGMLIETTQGGTYDLRNASGRHRFNADIINAEYEVDHMTERILAQKSEARAEGKWLGGPVPFGWQPAREGGLEVNKFAADAIASACMAVLAGDSLREIGRAWDAAGLHPPRGGTWTHGQVRAILLRPRNAGLDADGSEPPAGAQWPAIVQEETWRSVRAVLRDPSRRGGPGPSRRWLLSGIALCGGCGFPVVTVKAAGGNRKAVYRCAAQARQLPRRTDVRHASRDAAQMNAFVEELVLRRLSRADAAGLLLPDHSGERAALLKREEGLKAQWDEQYPLYESGLIVIDELARTRRNLNVKLAEIRSRLAEIDEADVLGPALANPRGAWEAATLDDRRAIVSALLYITIIPAGRGRPAGWRPGMSYFDYESIDIRWRRRLPSDGQPG